MINNPEDLKRYDQALQDSIDEFRSLLIPHRRYFKECDKISDKDRQCTCDADILNQDRLKLISTLEEIKELLNKQEVL